MLVELDIKISFKLTLLFKLKLVLDLFNSFLLFVLWVAECMGLSAILFLIQRPIRRRAGIIARVAVLLLKILLLAVTAFLSISIISKITWNVGYLLGAVYVALGGDILAELICIPVVLIRKNKNNMRLQTVIVFLMSLAFMIFLSNYDLRHSEHGDNQGKRTYI